MGRPPLLLQPVRPADQQAALCPLADGLVSRLRRCPPLLTDLTAPGRCCRPRAAGHMPAPCSLRLIRPAPIPAPTAERDRHSSCRRARRAACVVVNQRVIIG